MIIGIGLSPGLFDSLQFTSMNSMAYADIESPDTSMASTIASSRQQMSMSFGLAWGPLMPGGTWAPGRRTTTSPLPRRCTMPS
jgi:hypothetical protein